MSQSLTVRSPLPDASILPPSRNATDDTRFEWPFSVIEASPVATSHSLTVFEFDAARYRPSGEKDTEWATVSGWPWSTIRLGSPGSGARSHNRAPGPKLPTARYRPSPAEKATLQGV